MKELSIEEKAKAYDEALEKARQLCVYPTTKPFISDLQDLFPELREESEDERIRKAILELVKQSSAILDKQNQNNMIAWLEKQGKNLIMAKSPQLGEQKPAWSKEDKEMLREALVLIETVEDKNKVKDCFLGVKTWLKSLKGRIGG